MNEDQLANFFELDKRVYIEFINADMDGELLDSDEGSPFIRHFVKMLYVVTEHGQVGRSISSIPFSRLLPYMKGEPLPDHLIVGGGSQCINHRYTIVSRMEEGNEVWLQVRHSVREPDDFPEGAVVVADPTP